MSLNSSSVFFGNFIPDSHDLTIFFDNEKELPNHVKLLPSTIKVWLSRKMFNKVWD